MEIILFSTFTAQHVRAGAILSEAPAVLRVANCGPTGPRYLIKDFHMTNSNMSSDTTKPAVAQPKPETGAPKHADVKVDVATPVAPAHTSKP
jgi:hypothetical protein